MIFIYALFDPRNGYIRYVGLTRDVKARIRRYRDSPHTLHLRNWFNSLYVLGLAPEMAIIDSTDSELESCMLERKWISKCREDGFDLINLTKGGERAFEISDEYRANLRIARRRRPLLVTQGPMPEETKKKISESHKERYRLGIGKSNFGALNKSRIGIPISDEAKTRQTQTWMYKRLLRRQQELKDGGSRSAVSQTGS
jgi:hypothetical protein